MLSFAFRHAVPSVAIGASGLLAALPWEIADAIPLVPPVLLLSLVHACVAVRPSGVPIAFVFALGLLIDVVTGEPMGYWALLLVMTVGMTGLVARNEGNRGTLLQWLDFGIVAMCVLTIGWAVASLYAGHVANGYSLAVSGLIAVAAYPAIGLATRRITGVSTARNFGTSIERV